MPRRIRRTLHRYCLSLADDYTRAARMHLATAAQCPAPQKTVAHARGGVALSVARLWLALAKATDADA